MGQALTPREFYLFPFGSFVQTASTLCPNTGSHMRSHLGIQLMNSRSYSQTLRWIQRFTLEDFPNDKPTKNPWKIKVPKASDLKAHLRQQ